ncbi:hypothetical protein ISS37_01550 [candidate division KSB1 bacterium]|nr:hypothetical protein [candidate division KSB1 bacterium]
MPKIPKKPEDIFEEFIKDFQKIYRDDLVSIILHGSGASGEYVPKKSDLNFLIVLSEAGILDLEKSFKAVAKWKRARVSTPLFLTLEYIQSSMDSYPIEFLNMKRFYRIVYGEDVLKDLAFKREHIRLQLEREMKGKLLQLRQAFLDTKGLKRGFLQLISVSVSPFISLFKALLYYMNEEIPETTEGTLTKVAEHFGLDASLFEELLAVKMGKKMNRYGLERLLDRYLEEIRKLTFEVDKLD